MSVFHGLTPNLPEAAHRRAPTPTPVPLARQKPKVGKIGNRRVGWKSMTPPGTLGSMWRIWASGPGNRKGADRLGFGGEGYKALLAGALSSLDLRVGASFAGQTALMLHGALREACETITGMPARFMTYPGSPKPILPVTRLRSQAPRNGMTIGTARLWSYGEMRVPGELWRALQRYAVWIEPSLTAEWVRLMRGYAARQARQLDEGRLAAAMTWADPARDVSMPRALSVVSPGVV
jgi:hypothetical protein